MMFKQVLFDNFDLMLLSSLNRRTEIKYCKYIFRSCSIVNVYSCKFVGHVPMLMFVIVKFFQTCSNQNLVIFIWSCELASNIFRYIQKEIGSGICCWQDQAQKLRAELQACTGPAQKQKLLKINAQFFSGPLVEKPWYTV